MIAEMPFTITRVEVSHPTLQAWLSRFEAQAPHFSHATDYAPGNWLGIFAGDDLICVFGYTHCKTNVVLVEYALCEPSRRGAIALRLLMKCLYEQWRGKHRMRFFVERANRKMRKMVEFLGANQVALLYEIGV